jgi:hypothetical protein
MRLKQLSSVSYTPSTVLCCRYSFTITFNTKDRVEYFNIIGIMESRRMSWKRIACMMERRKYAEELSESLK